MSPRARKPPNPPGPCTPGQPCTEDAYCPDHQRFSPLYEPARRQLAAALDFPAKAAAEERARRGLAGRKGRGRRPAGPNPVDPAKNPEVLSVLLPGKVVARFELRPFDDGKGGEAYDPLLVFTDGSALAFTTQETEVGEYGSDPCYVAPKDGEPTRRRKGARRG